MKYLTIIFILISLSLRAQKVDHIRMLMFRSDSFVINYFDSLSLITGKKIHLTKSVDKKGNLMILATANFDDISFYGFSVVLTIFERRKGEEICLSQTIISDVYSIGTNLNYVKDNFIQIDDSIWVTEKFTDKTYIRVKFEVTDKKTGHCTLDYNFFVE
jgi:hypothetical protein